MCTGEELTGAVLLAEQSVYELHGDGTSCFHSGGRQALQQVEHLHGVSDYFITAFMVQQLDITTNEFYNIPNKYLPSMS